MAYARNTWSMMLSAVPLVFLLIPFLQKGALGFKGISWIESGSKTHQQITVEAILETTVQVCRDVAIAEGRDISSAVSHQGLKKIQFWSVRKCVCVYVSV